MKDSRPSLNQLIDDARKRRFDAVLVWRFDRFARSTRFLVNTLEEFRNLGVDFVSFSESIDTSSPLGGAVFTIISAVAQLERDIISERVRAGLRRAKRSGKRLGRSRVKVSSWKLRQLHSEGLSTRQIAKKVGVSKTTVCDILRQERGGHS
jgi:DNA invertase Pin-like site-specific DNA recombinase